MFVDDFLHSIFKCSHHEWRCCNNLFIYWLFGNTRHSFLWNALVQKAYNKCIKAKRKKNSFAWKSHVILKSCFQCSLVCSTLHSSRKKTILNIHALIVFLHFTMRWWISLSIPSLKIQFHTYLIRSSKQFLHFVIFNDACHQTHRESASSHPYCLNHHHHTQFVSLPTFTGLYLLEDLRSSAQRDDYSPRAPIMEHLHVIY